jgi:branched-chain amino acid transport system permease protein
VVTSKTGYYYLMIFLVVLGVAGANSLRHSRVGRAWHFIREDEDAALAMGVNTALFKLYAYITGAVWASMVGAVYAVSMTAIAPESFSYSQSVLILIAVILGGLGSIPGVLIGAVLVTVLPELLRAVASFRLLVFSILMVVFMIARPQGLWPENVRGVFKARTGPGRTLPAGGL